MIRVLIHRRVEQHVAACMIAATLARLIQADTITLKPHIFVGERDGDIRLAQIAELDGPEAQRLAELVIVRRGGAGEAMADQRLSVQQVREMLSQAGAHWGRINLQGSAVTIQVVGAAQNGPEAMASISLSPRPRDRTAASAPTQSTALAADSIIEEPTLRGEIARLFCSKLHVQPGDLRLSFASIDDRILGQSLVTARFEIQPTSVLASDRATMTVREWIEGASKERWNLTVHPTIRVKAAAMTGDVRKGQQITEEEVEAVEAWLPAGQAAALASREQVVGRLATSQLRQGALIRRADVHRQAIVQRGERIIVRCLVGGSVITMQAEARSDGGEGDVIELRKIGERDTFYATVSGPREAVIDLARPIDLPPEQPPVTPITENHS